MAGFAASVVVGNFTEQLPGAIVEVNDALAVDFLITRSPRALWM